MTGPECGVCRDIEEHERVAAELSRANARLALALRCASAGMWERDIVGGRLVWSDELFRMFGLEPLPDGLASFELWRAVLHPDDREAALARAHASVRDRKPMVNDYRIVRPDGEVRWIQAFGNNDYDVQGQPVRTSGICVDVTERKLAELQAFRDLTAARDEAQAASQAKSEFLANISHEIRTPMTAIMGLTELCMSVARSERQFDYLLKVKQASAALLEIINDLLDFSKMEAGKLELTLREFSLDSVLDNVAALLGEPARRRGLELQFDLDPNLPALVRGDAQRLGQVLTNLVSNAIKFSERGPVRVAARFEMNNSDRAAVRFEVSDQGIGMSEAQQRKLFQPFSQVDAQTSRRYGGTGLGLAISRGLVETMGGSISVHSEAGRGSTFAFTLPLGVATAPLSEAAQPAPSAQVFDTAALALCQGAEILVVEDVALIGEIVATILGRGGLRVRVAASGRSAIRAVAQRRPDAILMDCQMPGMDGYETTRRLRLDPHNASLPIIALSASASAQDFEKCLAAGMTACVSKPIDIPHLYALLASVLVRPLEQRPAATLAPAATDSARAAALPDLPGIDVSAGMAGLAHDDLERYTELLRLFRDGDGGSFAADLAAAVRRRAWKKAGLRVHSLRGTAQMLGALTLSEHARSLYEAIVGRDRVALAAAQAATVDELQRVAAGLAQL